MKWISVKDAPLFEPYGSKGKWVTTDAADHEFIAAVETNKGWWIRHCVVEENTGLCVVGEDGNEPAGYDLTDVTYYVPITKPDALDETPPPIRREDKIEMYEHGRSR